MPNESVDFVTYYNIFEYAYPVCLLTVSATLVYVGIGLWKSSKLLVLPTKFTTLLFGLFLLPTFLHSINHITDTIINTPQNNALNWLGLVGIPLLLLFCGFIIAGQMVFGSNGAETRETLFRVLEQHEISWEKKGWFRVSTAVGTFTILPFLDRKIVLVYLWPSPFVGAGAKRGKRLFAELEARLVNASSDQRQESVRVAAFTLLFCGTVLGALSFISWATSVLMVNPAWRNWV